MILRRITEHVKTQNWFAVWLDLVIVVVGVFIGIQVANWNSATQARSKELVILEQLATQFASAVEDAKKAKVGSDANLEATRTVLRVIRDGKEPEDKAAFLETLRSAGSFISGPGEPITLTELLATGGLSEMSSPGLRRALIRYHEISVSQNELADLVLARVSTPHDGFHDALYVNPDFAPNSGNLLNRYDWSQIAGTRQQFQVIFYGKLGLKANIDEEIVRGEAVLAEIEQARR
jgi:hypothetical protein